MSLGWLIAIPACVAGARWFTAGDRARRFTAPPPCEQPSGRTHAARAAWALRRTARASFGNAVSGVILVRHVLAHPLRYRGGAIGYPVYWAGDMLTLYASLRGFGAHLAPELLILAYASGNVITSLPLPAGGAGGVEAAGALTLHVVGVALAPALLAVFVYRLVTFWLPVLPALLLVPSMRRLGEKLSSVPHSERDPDERISFRPPADAAA
jgi:hypothetical protein